MSRRVIVGTAGHIDHGKSALVRALTGTDPDRLKEEKERGITIELGFAHLRLPSGTLAGIVDVPGHERFVRTMVAGAAGIDIVLLVVAADEGVKPQTREHLDICRLLAVRHGLIVMNKCDKVDEEWAALQEEELRAFVRGTFLEDAPLVRVSAATGEGVPELAAQIDRLASVIPGKDPSHFFRLPVDRSFTMKGFGTVVTGTVVGGTIRAGEEVCLLPDGPSARIRGIQVHGGPAESVSAGTRAAINLQGVEKDQAVRGAVLARPGTVSPTRDAEVFLEYLPLSPKPLKNRARVTFHAGTASSTGRVLVYGAPEIPPGGSGFARIELDGPMTLLSGDRFILRGFSPLENFGYTVGGGGVLHPHPPRRRGAAKAVPPALPALMGGDPAARTLAALEDAGVAGMEDRTLAAVAGLGPEETRREVDRHKAGGRVRSAQGAGGWRHWHRNAVETAARMAAEALLALHRRFPDRGGFPREEILAALPGISEPALLDLALAGNAGAEREGELFFLPASRPRSVELSTPLARSIADAVRQAGLSGPGKGELAEVVRPPDAKAFEKTLEGLVRSGEVLRIKELHFDPASVADLKDRLVAFLERKGEITVPEFKDMAGLSRKYVIPLIEHFDQAKVTLRIGDRRVLRKGK